MGQVGVVTFASILTTPTGLSKGCACVAPRVPSTSWRSPAPRRHRAPPAPLHPPSLPLYRRTVEYATPRDAAAAIELLSGRTIAGRSVFVRLDRRSVDATARPDGAGPSAWAGFTTNGCVRCVRDSRWRGDRQPRRTLPPLSTTCSCDGRTRWRRRRGRAWVSAARWPRWRRTRPR